MTRLRIGLPVLASVLLVALAWAPSAHALSGCASNAASAIDQYCEQFPSATGGPTPMGPGAPTLASTLPARTARRFLRSVISGTVGPARLSSGSRNRVGLLSIPPYRHVPPAGSVAVGGGWPLLRTLALVLAGVVLILLAAALLRRHSRVSARPAGGA